MSDDDLLPSAFTKEKSLWAIYIQARRIPTNKFNAVTTLLVFLGAVVTSWLSEASTSATIKMVREFATLGFNGALTVLGFLVAGFTIFATISNPNMLIRMGAMRHLESGLSWLKFTFFILIRTFLYFLVFAVFCYLVIFFGGSGGLVATLVKLSPYPREVTFALAKIAFVVMATFQYFLLVQLKSFIFNVYHSVVAALRWRAEGYD
ncbi:MAG: hypothetical protein ACREO4_05450 [Lysobacter sp.]